MDFLLSWSMVGADQQGLTAVRYRRSIYSKINGAGQVRRQDKNSPEADLPSV